MTFTLIFYSCTKSEPQKQTQQQVKQTTGAGSIATIVPNGTYNYTAAISPTTKSTLTMVKTGAGCTITTSTSVRTTENFTVFSFDLPWSASYTVSIPSLTSDYWFIPLDPVNTPVRLSYTGGIGGGNSFKVTCSCPEDATKGCTQQYNLTTNSYGCVGDGANPCSCCSTTTSGLTAIYGSGVIAELTTFTYNGVSY